MDYAEKQAAVPESVKARTGASAGTAAPKPWQKHEHSLKGFRSELLIAGYSPKTLDMYLMYVKDFLNYAKKAPVDARREDIVNFMAYKRESQNCSGATLALAHAALKYYFHNYLKSKIVDDIKIPKKSKKLPTVLTKPEIKALFKATKAGRNRLTLEFLYSAGCRVSEAVKLRTEDLDFREKIARIRGGKGGKDRVIILSTSWITELKKYLKRKKIKSEYVFSKKNGKPISPDTIQRIIKLAAGKAGLQKHVTPHSLRHSYATHLLEAGESIRKIQVLLGHNDLSTTQIYTKVSTDELKKVKSPFDNM